MRTQALLRRSRTLFKASAAPRLVFCSSARPSRPPRKEQSLRTTNRLYAKRLSSTTTPPATDPSASPPEEPASGPSDPSMSSGDTPEPPNIEPEKPRPRRARVSTVSTKDTEPLQLPEDLDILKTPSTDQVNTDPAYSATLPPSNVLEEALNNLHITLHPQTQHRATYASPTGPPIEPTLALYCPIEGGEYVIDATVSELARRTGAEILVLDAVQLAAGEWGQFGEAANSLQLPRNPLHFPSSPPSPPANPRSFMMDDDEEDSNAPPQMFSPSHQMTLTVMSPPSLQGRAMMASSSRRNPSPSKVKIFFDALINLPSEQQELSDPPPPLPSSPKPRLVYIRDFPTLAPTSAAWYPPLLSAVRQRRRGPISKPTSPITNPMTIIFGITPSLTPPVAQTPSSGPSSGLMSLLMSRNPSSSHASPSSKPGKSDWSEDETAEKAREKRLRDRLRKWEKGDAALQDELPHLSTINPEGNSRGDQRPEIFVIGGPSGMPGLPPVIGAGVPAGSRDGGHEPENDGLFFRTSILVPNVRSLTQERSCRVARRREINELTMRMGVGAVGGVLEKNAEPLSSTEGEVISDGPILQTDQQKMWDDWGKRVEVWSNVRQIADRAVGSEVAALRTSSKPEKFSLDPTLIPWSAVHRAWTAHRSARDLRKAWTKDSSPSKTLRDQDEEDEDEDEDEAVRSTVDEVIERVKQDPDLDPHEQRLLPSIIDSASMPTSFSQVHLPPHTIDSVRTIVSLPLLHPAAFQQGILKEHGMTGCLLFGPPGTGKTLVVRALAKEAGCRMMSISPSDVMDMYVGEGEKLVKAVFSLARRLSPCVVFLDEIDALFGARMSARESGGAFAHRGVITEFMQEMDGLKSSKEDSIIVIGATNRPFDLDDAVLRRLPRRLLVDLPGEKEREEILKILLRDEILAPDLDIKALAKRTESFSGSDLKHLCVSAALDSVKEQVQVPWSSSSNPILPPAVNAPDDTPSTSAQVPAPSTVDSVDTIDKSMTTPAMPSAPSVTVDISNPSSPEDSAKSPESLSRILHLRNFDKALKEITPSSSESLGSLADLRKWNEEFGEGRKDKKRQQVWGKGRFGFTDRIHEGGEDGRVAAAALINTSLNLDITRVER